jgi:SulP family sulfate permease
MIFMAQAPHVFGISNMAYIFIATTLIILYDLPRYIKSIPSSVIAIVVLTGVAIFSGIELIIVGDWGAMT